MSARTLILIGLGLLASGCAGLTDGAALDAAGCRPAMAIYQPPVRLGGSGTILHIPRSCPPRPAPAPSDAVGLPPGP